MVRRLRHLPARYEEESVFHHFWHYVFVLSIGITIGTVLGGSLRAGSDADDAFATDTAFDAAGAPIDHH
jgi:hypothetical protein